MSGYLFTFSDDLYRREAAESGLYSTFMSLKWNGPVASTLGDFVTMRPGDSVYFFSKRIVYGIGKIVEIVPETAAIENYPGSTQKSSTSYAFIIENSLMDKPIVQVDNKERVKRWIIAFEPSPYFFRAGIDMDDLLMSNPRAFRSTRVFQGKSFIKLDDEEDAAFRSAILQRNIDSIHNPSPDAYYECNWKDSRAKLIRRANNRDVSLKVSELLSKSSTSGKLSNEMLLEVGLLKQLADHDPDTESVFGTWDYLSHQVAASPMKPISWMEYMDVFGIRYLDGYAPVVEKYGIFELKKDVANGGDIQQVMKYVDWVNREYGTGDYSLIQAFLVAHSFDFKSFKGQEGAAERKYTIGRPFRAETWNGITFVTYDVDEDGHLSFAVVNPWQRS